MRRKRRIVRNPRRKAAFSKTEYKRAIKTTQDLGLPVQKVDFFPSGGFSVVVGKTTSDSAANENPWDTVLTPQPN
jgi:hypothetical protein